MARHKVSSISSIFDSLYQRADEAGETIRPPSPDYRMVASGSTDDEQAFAVAELIACHKFTPRLQVAVFDVSGTRYLLRVGFEHPWLEDPEDYFEGLHLAALADLQVQPNAGGLVISNLLQENHSGVPGYLGHRSTDIASLFPRMDYFQIQPHVDVDECFKLFIRVASHEARLNGSWIEEGLERAIDRLLSGNCDGMPLRWLLRGVFDLDPRGLFLALYRCLEALYARNQVTRLKGALGLQGDWRQISVDLQEHLTWRPREAQSIASVLAESESELLSRLYVSLGYEGDVPDDCSQRCAKGVYEIRNNLVHFSAGSDDDFGSGFDWNSLSLSLCDVIGSVYEDRVEITS